MFCRRRESCAGVALEHRAMRRRKTVILCFLSLICEESLAASARAPVFYSQHLTSFFSTSSLPTADREGYLTPYPPQNAILSPTRLSIVLLFLREAAFAQLHRPAKTFKRRLLERFGGRVAPLPSMLLNMTSRPVCIMLTEAYSSREP